MINTVTRLQMILRNIDSTRALVADQPQAKHATEQYKAKLPSVHTAKDFVSNYDVFSYAMKAYGLEDMIYAKGFMQKVLEGGTSNPKSMANSLADPRFKAIAKDFDFTASGAASTTSTTAVDATIAKFMQQSLEDTVGKESPGAQLALYFQRKAPAIKSTLHLMADKALYQFVLTAFRIPAAPASETIDATAARIKAKLDVADLQDPAKLKKLMTRFAAMYDMENASNTSNISTALLSGSNIALGNASQNTLSSDLLARAQRRYSSF